MGAAYCRNVAASRTASLLTRVLSASTTRATHPRGGAWTLHRGSGQLYDWRSGRDEKRVLYNFNDVASAVRRELWERHPFPRTPFGEDVLMARALYWRQAARDGQYDDEATVEHSHDYDR